MAVFARVAWLCWMGVLAMAEKDLMMLDSVVVLVELWIRYVLLT